MQLSQPRFISSRASLYGYGYQAIIDDIEKTVWSKSPRINVGNIKRIFK